MGEDKTGEGEEEVNTESANAHDIWEDRDGEQPEGIKWPLQVVQQHPRGGNESDAG